ncbi:MAG: T9SS type A sorting domain-containing protein [Candidatus Marinimicrobia bacterium]|nr:T9SS type A sorting domain-containing protein [Candidatus Neomarinimicrobiota bacterium]
MKKTRLFFCLMLFSLALFGQTSIAPLAGDGSEENPYQIASLENLYWIASTDGAGGYCIQTADIDAGPTVNWFDGEGWVPIGLDGFYNGQGHVIDHLFIDRDTTDVGLFAWGGDVINLQLTNVNITGRSSVGSLVGYNGSFGYINNCHSSGIVRGTGEVGGLVGWSQQSRIMNSSYDGTVIGINLGDSVLSTNIGGLAGANGMGSISYSFSKGSVSGHTCIGGLAGSNWGTFSNNYSTANVSGWECVGGLSGSSVGSGYSPSTTENCFSTGSVSGNSLCGGLTGVSDSLYTSFSNSYWDMETSGQNSSDGGTGKTTAEMKTQTTFTNVGWDFMNIWGMNGAVNNAYPHLLWQIHPEPSVQTLSVDEISSDSAKVFFQISTFGLPYREIAPYIIGGVCCGEMVNPTIDSLGYRAIFNIYSVGNYSLVLNYLDPNTKYYVRAYATNILGTFYGDTISFETLGQPSITGLDVTDIDSISAVATAEVTCLGNPYPTQHGFCWNSIGNPSIEDCNIQLGSLDSVGVFSAKISGLTSNAWCYIRPYATNTLGTFYGGQQSFITLTTSISDMIPDEYFLSQNWPNPFNPSTTLQYGLPEVSDIKLNIFDITGRKIKQWSISNQQPGWHKVIWDGTDMNGNMVSTGVYIYSLIAGDFVDTKKMVFMK